MSRIYKKLVCVLAFFCIISCNSFIENNIAQAAPATKSAPAVAYLSVSPLDVVDCPSKYLNKNITFNAEFVSYTALGLDYKPAFRDGSKYIGILIKRPDVLDHVIPLSEMKIFVLREEAEKHMDIDSGDKISLSGKVFSTALGDPWVEVKTFNLLTPKKKTNKK